MSGAKKTINDMKIPDEQDLKSLMEICKTDKDLQLELDAEKDYGLLQTIQTAYDQLSLRGKGVCLEQLTRSLVNHKEEK